MLDKCDVNLCFSIDFDDIEDISTTSQYGELGTMDARLVASGATDARLAVSGVTDTGLDAYEATDIGLVASGATGIGLADFGATYTGLAPSGATDTDIELTALGATETWLAASPFGTVGNVVRWGYLDQIQLCMIKNKTFYVIYS